jgi:hypothetical protein
VDNKDKLKELLLGVCLPVISPYDYDRNIFSSSIFIHDNLVFSLGIKFIFSLILRIDVNHCDANSGIQIIDLLSHYVRINQPSLSELVLADPGNFFG